MMNHTAAIERQRIAASAYSAWRQSIVEKRKVTEIMFTRAGSRMYLFYRVDGRYIEA